MLGVKGDEIGRICENYEARMVMSITIFIAKTRNTRADRTKSPKGNKHDC